ncbi:MAG: GGDEF domain-containing protein [Proteobacteria bacterium]|nr:GGDEF domain-containing protein [Pseudomonadota bacterium]
MPKKVQNPSGPNPASNFDRVINYLAKLRKITSNAVGKIPALDQISRILETATEVAGGVSTTLYVPRGHIGALIPPEKLIDGRAGLSEIAELVCTGSIAEKIAKSSKLRNPELLEDGTMFLLPLSIGGMAVLDPDVEVSNDLLRMHVLQIISDLTDKLVIDEIESNGNRKHTKELENMRQNLLRMNMSLRERTMIDELTGLYNRRFFERSLAYEIERFRRYQHAIGIILLDVDFFKKVNDTYGHAIGDEVLKHLVHVAQNNIRTADLLARYGGEEFVALLPNTGLESTTITGERLRAKVAETPLLLDQGELVQTISVGITSVDGNFKGSADQVLRAADKALYRAKAEGRNRIVVATAQDFAD